MTTAWQQTDNYALFLWCYIYYHALLRTVKCVKFFFIDSENSDYPYFICGFLRFSSFLASHISHKKTIQTRYKSSTKKGLCNTTFCCVIYFFVLRFLRLNRYSIFVIICKKWYFTSNFAIRKNQIIFGNHHHFVWSWNYRWFYE